MNEKRPKTELFDVLNDFISVSHEKFLITNLRAKERRAWARLGKDCIMAYGKLLEANKLEQVARDIQEIKPFIIKKWSREDAITAKTT